LSAVSIQSFSILVLLRITLINLLAFHCRTLFKAARPLAGVALLPLALTLAPPGKAQMPMNLAPQAIPNSTVGPGYGSGLSVFKQDFTVPKPGPSQSQTSGASGPDAAPQSIPNPQSTPTPQAAAPTEAGCELKVAQMNDIQRLKVVRVHSGRCLMVFNAND